MSGAAQATGFHEVLGREHQSPHPRFWHRLLRIQGLRHEEAPHGAGQERHILRGRDAHIQLPGTGLLPPSPVPQAQKSDSSSPSPEQLQSRGRDGVPCAVSDISGTAPHPASGLPTPGPAEDPHPRGPSPAGHGVAPRLEELPFQMPSTRAQRVPVSPCEQQEVDSSCQAWRTPTHPLGTSLPSLQPPNKGKAAGLLR